MSARTILITRPPPRQLKTNICFNQFATSVNICRHEQAPPSYSLLLPPRKKEKPQLYRNILCVLRTPKHGCKKEREKKRMRRDLLKKYFSHLRPRVVNRIKMYLKQSINSIEYSIKYRLLQAFASNLLLVTYLPILICMCVYFYIYIYI